MLSILFYHQSSAGLTVSLLNLLGLHFTFCVYTEMDKYNFIDWNAIFIDSSFPSREVHDAFLGESLILQQRIRHVSLFFYHEHNLPFIFSL